jgi:hypothetical protein
MLLAGIQAIFRWTADQNFGGDKLGLERRAQIRPE